jgi:hypothetical protein
MLPEASSKKRIRVLCCWADIELNIAGIKKNKVVRVFALTTLFENIFFRGLIVVKIITHYF